MMQSILMALAGGALIGLAASLMLVLNGRVTGISGIANGLLTLQKGDYLWRATFVVGLIAGGVVLAYFQAEMFANTSARSEVMIAIAGVIVGFGTVLGSGCTSGHGVCGISRLSPRSLIATIIFMLVGMITATILKSFLGV
ncbi:YeeE/YedE family protein [Bdellovibrio sp. ZAP7]|uniref:YeeE/YedE family protein n=1 Tax=Bdellovibrio sp. ZAP7 TaxID=2231053 RepID=UPI001FEFC994|nr:YeeE/YedE family protein [Bdellovibrio sp. ZAP7]